MSQNVQKHEQKQLPKIKKLFTYILIAMFAIIIAKWIILEFIPTSDSVMPIDTNNSTKEVILSPVYYEEVNLTIDFFLIQKKIEKEYESTKKDIDLYIEEEFGKQKQHSYYKLCQEDGFLDWIFGYFTGYKMLWKKTKGIFGSDDNEVKMVSDKFQEDVIQPNLHSTFTKIQSFTKNRIDDYYKNVILITSEHINDEIKKLEAEGYTNIQIEQKTIPWGKYIVTSSTDGFVVAELAGISSVGVVAGKVIGAKVATLLGPKMIGLLSAKTASVVASKFAAAFSLIFAPLVDYGLNEGAKKIKYDETKQMFEEMISDILNETKADMLQKSHQALEEVKNTIYKKLNKKAKIKGVK